MVFPTETRPNFLANLPSEFGMLEYTLDDDTAIPALQKLLDQ